MSIMRRLLIVLFCLSSTPMVAQWNPVFPWIDTPIDVSVVDDSTAYILQYQSSWNESTLYKSTNGARTWKKLTITPIGLSRIYFLDSLNGFGISGGKVYKTIDGARSWSDIQVAASSLIVSIQFTNQNTGYVCTSGQGVFKTTDGGKTWIGLSGSPATANTYSNYPMSFFGEVGYLIGADRTYLTKDGGATWSDQVIFNAQNILAIDENVVYASTYYETQRSVDGGATWNPYFNDNSIPVHIPGKKDLFLDNYSTIMRVNDDGTSFQQVYRSTFSFSWEKVSAAGNLVICIGQDNSVVKSNDAGASWSLINGSPQNGNFRDFHFLDEKNGFVMGPYRALLRTPDNGESWAYDESFPRDDFDHVEFADADTGIFVFSYNYANKTYDGGKTLISDSWNPAIFGQPSYDYKMLSSKVIYSVGSNGSLAKSVDGGLTWDDKSFSFSNSLYSIDCLNADTCHAAGAVGKIVSTWDGGVNWKIHDLQINQDLGNVFILNSTVAFAAGRGIILRTNDSGRTWSAINIDFGNHVVSFLFTSIDTGYAVTSWGYIYKTDDQGATWNFVPMSTTVNYMDIEEAFIRNEKLFAITSRTIWAIPLSQLDVQPVSVTDLNIEPVKPVIYPNPTNGQLYISIDEPLVSVQIHDAQANLIRKYDEITGSMLDLSDLPGGFYIVRIEGKDRITTSKIIKR